MSHKRHPISELALNEWDAMEQVVEWCLPAVNLEKEESNPLRVKPCNRQPTSNSTIYTVYVWLKKYFIGEYLFTTN